MKLRNRKRKPLLDKTNSSINNSVLNGEVKGTEKNNNLLIKRTNNKIIQHPQIRKMLRVSLERNAHLENQIKKKMDVYEFTFDPAEEPVKKIKKGRRQQLVDDSGDENNSMKEVVHRLRLKEQLKKKARVVKKVIVVNKINTQLRKNGCKMIKESIPECKQKDININNVDNQQKYNKSSKEATEPKKLPEISKQPCTNFDNDDFEGFDDNYENIHTPIDENIHSPIDENIKTIVNEDKCQKTLQEEICDSFLNDLDNYDDTSTHLGPQNMLSKNIINSLDNLKRNMYGISKVNIENNSPNIDIISNVIIQPANKTNAATKQMSIVNNSIKSALDNSNPWRLSVSCKSPHTFTVKDKSFVPNYDQDIVINSILADKILPAEKSSILKKDKCKQKKSRKNLIKNTSQSSILSFVSSTKENTKEVIRSGRIFESPRKILGEINFMQSTPFQPNTRQKIISPNYSIIEFEEKQNKNALSSLFGFSYDENSENIDPRSVVKTKVLKKRSPKKEKLKTVLFNDVVEVKNIENVKDVPEEIFSLPAADIDVLFQDVENNTEKLHVKKSRRSYERIRPKRKRLPSVQSDESDDDDSIIEIKVKEKQANKRTKKEEEEAEKLALQYNSMFEEIEKHTLCID